MTEINKKQLVNNNFYQNILNQANDIISEDRFREAYNLAKDLELSLGKTREIKDKNYELYKKYWNLIAKLRWVGLPIVTESRIPEMFKSNLKTIYYIEDFDVQSKLRVVLLGMVIYEDRDKLKKKLISSLLNNQERITNKKIIIEQRQLTPSIGNWLKDYNSTLGTGRVRKLERTQYLVSGKNIKNLNKEEKRRVKILFDLYEKLKLSSLTLEGLEEDIPVDEDGKIGMIKGGIFEPFRRTKEQILVWQMTQGSKKNTEKATLENLQQLAQEYPENSLERKAIEEEINKLKVKS